MNGKPSCAKCNGRGGVFHRGRWHRCECVRPSRAQIEASRKLFQFGDRQYKSPFGDNK